MKICIIGGGATGWWAAGYLEHTFPDYQITLYESDTIPIVGVGESTLPQIANFFNSMGLEEEKWMPGANAIRKLGNIKRGWTSDVDVPFTFWSNENNKFDKHMSEYANKKIDKLSLLDSFNEDNVHAYHLDADSTGHVVRDNCKQVKHVIATLDSLPEGYDLYLDCTGFAKKFVKDKTTITPPDLFVDSAWVCPFEIPSDYPTQYTQSIARDSGWQFVIDLQNRIGTGYCYSSTHQSDETAKEEFLKYTDGLTPYNQAAPRKLKWQPGYLENPWTDNVVALGLASGFIDPLESNALFMIQYSITTLASCLKRGLGSKAYNRAVRKVWKDNCTYIRHHYSLTTKDTSPFWQHYLNMDSSKTLWENYSKHDNRYTNLYPDSIWATLGLYFNDIAYYRSKT